MHSLGKLPPPRVVSGLPFRMLDARGVAQPICVPHSRSLPLLPAHPTPPPAQPASAPPSLLYRAAHETAVRFDWAAFIAMQHRDRHHRPCPCGESAC
jgi:hypothetical protein